MPTDRATLPLACATIYVAVSTSHLYACNAVVDLLIKKHYNYS